MEPNHQNAISMIVLVRNEEENIGPFLDHHREGVDEMVVLDTGSTDRTREIAFEKGAAVHEREWPDDFALARNWLIELSPGPWILSLDPDERIAKGDFPTLRGLTKVPRPVVYSFENRNYRKFVGAYGWVPCKGEYPQEEKDLPGYVPSTKFLLFPKVPGIRFRYPIHELVDLDAVRKAKIPVKRAPFPIHHYGMVDYRGAFQVRNDLYLRLGLKKIEQYPNDRSGYHELGVHHELLGNNEEAEKWFRKSIEVNSTSYLSLLHLGILLIRKQECDEAKTLFTRIAQSAGHLYEPWFYLGRIAELEKDWSKAVGWYSKALQIEPNHANIHAHLGITFYQMGLAERCQEHLRRGLSQVPNLPDAQYTLGTCLLQQGKTAEAVEVLQQAVQMSQTSPDAHANLGAALLMAGQIDAARQELEKAIVLNSEHVDALANLGAVYAQQNLGDKALELLERACRLRPDHAGARKNLERLHSEMNRNQANDP